MFLNNFGENLNFRRLTEKKNVFMYYRYFQTNLRTTYGKVSVIFSSHNNAYTSMLQFSSLSIYLCT